MSVSILNRYTSAVIATIAGSTLSGVDFGGLNLTNADLSNKDLSSSSFKGANISGATLQNSNCNGTNFYRSNLEGCDLRGITQNTSTCFLCCHFESVLITAATPVIVVFYGGQSNCVGTEAGSTPGLPDSAVKFYFNQIGTYDSGTYIDLQINPNSGNHGSEYTFCEALKASYDVVYLKLCKGATTMSDWVPGQSAFTSLSASFIDAMNELIALYPGRYFRFVFKWYLGEDDARAVSGGNSYGADFLSFQAGIASLASQNVWKRFHTVLTQSWLALAKPNALAGCRYWESRYSGWTINVDSLPAQGDNVHLTVAGEDSLGLLQYASVLLQLAESWP